MAFYKYNTYNIYFEEMGTGFPTIFLHGNTASSKMFHSILPLYQEKFSVILIDFLGHGKSDRLKKFPADLWFDEAMQVIQLIKALKYQKVNLIGTSGGALVAINVALERPDLVNKIVADSFEGEYALTSFAKNIMEEREISKKIPELQSFYEFNHGKDWNNIIDNDTYAIHEHYRSIKKFFHKDIGSLQTPILMTGSREDDFMKDDFFENTYSSLLHKIVHGKIYIFSHGQHPAIISNSVKFAELAKNFLTEE